MAGLILALLLASSPANQFVKANGVTLQYVDWGGRDHRDVILLLPGLGDDVHRFDPFAPRFVDRFHVIGFSRRGQGESETPSDNYSTDTLVEDIRAFLDARRIDRVDLIGHSIAGVEMTRFAVKYPARARHIAVGKRYEPFELGYKSGQIAIFKRDMRRGQVVEFRDTDHFFFNDPKKVDAVVETIRGFLAKP